MPRKADMPCAGCGKLMWRNGSSLAEGVARCRDCRHSYRRGCRCDECKAGQAAAMRDYAAKYRAKHGGDWRSNYPDSPRTWISVTRRLAVYERDGWRCHLCTEFVDRTAESNTDFAPSLDHLIPRVDGGDDSESNLKCAHRLCNSKRGARALEVA